MQKELQIKPFDEEIHRLQGEEKIMRQHRAELSGRLVWYVGFRPQAAKQRARALAAKIATCEQEQALLEAKRQERRKAFDVADEKGARTLDPRTWFASERAVARRQAEGLASEINELTQRIDELYNLPDEDGLDIRCVLSTLNNDLVAHARFDADEVRTAIEAADARLARMLPEMQQLQARKRSLERAIEAPLRLLEAKQAERATLENLIRRAERFNAQLKRAHSNREKALIHQECERQLGHGSPGRVKSEKQNRLAPLNRTIEKLEREIKDELRRARLDVRAVIVDGNNIANDASDTFIGLTALEALLPQLAQGRTVIVNFDPGFPRKAKLTRTEIQKRLALAKVYFVPRGGAADPFLIEFAGQNPHTYVISNDRFADHAYRDAIGEGRVLTHAILNGRAAIPDLRISVPLPETVSG